MKMRYGIPTAIVVIGLTLACAKASRIETPAQEPPQRVSSPPLVYPPDLYASGVEGTVVLRAFVDTEGRVDPATIRVLSSTQAAFEEPAIAMLKGTRFEAGRLGGEPIRSLVDVPVRFEIASQAALSESDSLALQGALEQGERLARQGRMPEALDSYARAQSIDSRLTGSAAFWSVVCWYGSLGDWAAEVLPACDQAVALAPNRAEPRDARGLARALTGDLDGAAEDYTIFVTLTEDGEAKAERAGWLSELRRGQSPFTAEVLESLRQRNRSGVM